MTLHGATRPTFDLQSHSTYSDGSLRPSEVVARAAQAGVTLLALSDHDTVGGVDEAREAGAAHGVDVVPAVEISALHGDYEDFHILGYGLDHRLPALLEALEAYRLDRAARARRMIEALEALGFHLTGQALQERFDSGLSVGRPHLARAVKDHPANAARLHQEGLATPEQVLQAYLLPGTAAYRGRSIPTVREAIRQIHAAGGLAVWAHPFWDLAEPARVMETLETFAGFGIDGVESFYVTHTAQQVALLDDAARSRGLLSTGSSDFHGPSHATFSAFRRHALYGREAELGPIRP